MFSSIVFEAIRTILSLFFFHEKILSVTKHQNAKQTIFILLEVFVRAKIYCVCCLVLAHFCFVTVVGFCLMSFCALKIFC